MVAHGGKSVSVLSVDFLETANKTFYRVKENIASREFDDWIWDTYCVNKVLWNVYTSLINL